MFECYISHRRSVVVLYMLYTIRCNPVHPLNGSLPVPYVPVRVTSGASVAHRYTYAPPRCRTSLYLSTAAIPQYSPLSVSVERFCLPWIGWYGADGFQEKGQCFYIGLRCSHPFSLLLFSLSIDQYCGAGVFGMIGCKNIRNKV